jgi:hypothetical protein
LPGPTISETTAEFAAPGSGLFTINEYAPGFGAEIDAANSVFETNVVGTATPFQKICAPYINFDPLIVIVVVPSEKLDGVTELIIGIGFRTLIFTIPGVSCGNALARLVIVTELSGVGTTAGAVYKPFLSTVPNCAFPPCTPFTQKVNGEPVTPVSVLNCSVWFTLTELPGTQIDEGKPLSKPFPHPLSKTVIVAKLKATKPFKE